MSVDLKVYAKITLIQRFVYTCYVEWWEVLVVPLYHFEQNQKHGELVLVAMFAGRKGAATHPLPFWWLFEWLVEVKKGRFFPVVRVEKREEPNKASSFTSEVVGGHIKKRKRKEESAAIEGKGTCLHCIITRHFANANNNTNDKQRSHLPLAQPNCISIQHLSVKPVTLPHLSSLPSSSWFSPLLT